MIHRPSLIGLSTIALSLLVLSACQQAQVPDGNSTGSTGSSAPAEATSSSLASSATMKIKLYFADNSGEFTVHAVTYTIPKTTQVLHTAMQMLLTEKAAGNLRNVIEPLHLTLDGVTLTNGIAEIRLSGHYTSAGIGDDARFQNEITYTAKQFSTVKKVKIMLNNCDFANMAKGGCE